MTAPRSGRPCSLSLTAVKAGPTCGFTTASDKGVVIHGPASKGFAGQLMLTQDGSLTWRQARF